MAEKKIVKSENKVEGKQTVEAKPVGSAAGLRIGAILLWLAGIGCEVLAIMTLVQKIHIFKKDAIDLIAMIAFLVIDLICVVIGSQLWKKSNRIDPASEKNKVKFWLWNNMGVIASVLAFVPFIIIALTDKNADKKTKTIAAVVAIIALLIAGVSSYDFNPVSSEQLQAAQNALGTTTVYWTENGNTVHKYHIDSDCYHLNSAKSDVINEGTVEQAFAGNATALCKTCAKAHDIEVDENGTVISSGANVDDNSEETLDIVDEADTAVDTVVDTEALDTAA